MRLYCKIFEKNNIFEVKLYIKEYFTPFAGVNMPKYAYIMSANGNSKGV